MVYPHIDDQVKELVVDLISCGWTNAQICDALQVSDSSIRRWEVIFEHLGTVRKPLSPLQGSVAIITATILDVIVGVYKVHPDIFLDELQLFLALHHDICISPSALEETLKVTGLTRKKLRKIAQERDLQACIDWANGIGELCCGDGLELVFADETSKNSRMGQRMYGHALSGERAEIVEGFGQGQRFSLVTAMSVDGYIAAHAVPDVLDAAEFYDWVAEEVVSQVIHNHVPSCELILHVYAQLLNMHPWPEP